MEPDYRLTVKELRRLLAGMPDDCTVRLLLYVPKSGKFKTYACRTDRFGRTVLLSTDDCVDIWAHSKDRIK